MDAVIQLWYSTALTADQRLNTTKTVAWVFGVGTCGGGDLQTMPARLLRPGGCLRWAACSAAGRPACMLRARTRPAAACSAHAPIPPPTAALSQVGRLVR